MFKAGDKVRVISGSHHSYFGRETGDLGTVRTVELPHHGLDVCVFFDIERGDWSNPLWLNHTQLALETKSILDWLSAVL